MKAVSPVKLLVNRKEAPVNDEIFRSAVAAWAARGLPGRLHAEEAARVLGFAEHDLQILTASGKLTPLGEPAPNAPKWFAAVEIIRLATDKDWLHKATKEVAKYWRFKRERKNTEPAGAQSNRRVIAMSAEKVSPKSSPKPSLNEQWEGDEGAMASAERAVAKSA